MSDTGPRLSFARRVGLALVAPWRALDHVQARGGGGVTDALCLVLLATLCFRLQDLSRALLFLFNGNAGAMLSQLMAVLGQEMREAVFVALGSGLVITVLAGRGRLPSLDFELGSVAFVPYFAARTLVRTLGVELLLGRLPRWMHQGATVVGLAGTLLVTLLAIRLARGRGDAPRPASLPEPPRTPALATAGVLAACLAFALVANARGLTRDFEMVKPLKRGSPAPAFSLPRVDGGSTHVTLDNLRGKVVLLDFWATWCQPCVAMLPVLDGLYAERRARGLEIVGINADGPGVSPDELRAFVREHAIPYPTLLDDGEVGERYRVSMLPQMVLVGRDGVVRAIFSGVTARSELVEAIDAALRTP